MKNDFSIKFLKLENDKQNMIYSPLSIKYALKMLNEGATGNTMSQIENILGEQDLIKYRDIGKALSLANAIYIRDTYSKYVKKDYKKILAKKYNAEVHYDSFYNARKINKWISNKTLGIIKNMVQNDLVQNPLNMVILINALAVEVEWKNLFDATKTGIYNFYMEDGSIMKATTMHLKTFSENIAYYKDEDITVLSMDFKKYKNTQLEFIAIMPENNLSDYIETFTIDEFNNILKKLSLASKTKNGVYISIPKFSFDYDLNLKNDLIKLGVTDAFDVDLASFSKISDKKIYVGNALHKASIDFTEKGIKAVASTVIATYDMMRYSKEQPKEITINKPFLYAIRDKNKNEIWFVGTVYRPTSWKDDKSKYKERHQYW